MIKYLYHRGLNISFEGQPNACVLKEVLDAIGTGLRLRRGNDGMFSLVSSTRWPRADSDPKPGLVDTQVGESLLTARILLGDGQAHPLLRKLTRDRNGDVAGWKESGFDGEGCDLYCMSI